MSDAMITVKINDIEVEVPKGTTIFKAAEKAGVTIPTFCYHDGLSIPANCRMCLVNTNKAPKLLPACYGQVMEGMEVWTEDEKTRKTRKATLEFILLHHPVDCPICDQAGECILQDNYFNYSSTPSRLFTKKGHKPKAVAIGPNVMLDAERCIVCTRCIRFCDEVSKSSELQIIHRGERSEITTFPGKELDNPYATCTADICPVGALTSRDFRFKRRVWLLKSTNSVCGGCSRGCNIFVDHCENTVDRYRPRYNEDVNKWWMCDAGRLSYQDQQEDRIEKAQVGAESVSLDEAIGAAAQRLEGAGKLAVVPSLLSTNEDLFSLAAFSKALGVGTWYVGGRTDGDDQDDLLIRNDKNPNRAGLAVILESAGITGQPLETLATDIASGNVTSVLWIGHEHVASAALLAGLESLEQRIVVATNANEWQRSADVLLPMSTFEEVDGTWTQFEGKVQRICRALQAGRDVLPLWQVLARLGAALNKSDDLPAASSVNGLFAEMILAVPAWKEASFASPTAPPPLYNTLPIQRSA
jgi:NADH-quinone oxidoreductase subunit G